MSKYIVELTPGLGYLYLGKVGVSATKDANKAKAFDTVQEAQSWLNAGYGNRIVELKTDRP